MVWGARSNAGGYREALADPAFDPEQSIAGARRLRLQYGYAINLEQAVTADLGLFARWSWRDARSEVMSWTDMDQSLAAGLLLKGTRWGRPLDAWGLGFALNGLSRDHRDYTAAGGLSLTVGDGRLSYSAERILETWYAIGLGPQGALTFDYQRAVSPAYNADRGPVSLYSMRLRGFF